MLRAILLPGESLWALKAKNYNPIVTFQLRMRLIEMDARDGLMDEASFVNYIELLNLVLAEDWPEC
jgi:hypothetical protein